LNIVSTVEVCDATRAQMRTKLASQLSTNLLKNLSYKEVFPT